MATFFDDEADRPEKPVAENMPADPDSTSQPAKKRKFQLRWPDQKVLWVIAGIAILVNIYVTFTHPEGEKFTSTESSLVTASFLYLFGFAMLSLTRLILRTPDPEDDSRTVGDKLRASRMAKKTASQKSTTLTEAESRILDQMEASMVEKKDQFDVVVLKDIWKFWQPDGRAAR